MNKYFGNKVKMYLNSCTNINFGFTVLRDSQLQQNNQYEQSLGFDKENSKDNMSSITLFVQKSPNSNE